MKKNVIALLLAVIMASGSVGAVPALAVETTAEEAVAVEEETMDENGEVTEEAETADGDIVSEEVSKDEPAHVEEKYYEEDVNTTGDNETMKSQDESADTATTSEVSYADEEAVECYAEIYDNSITEISNIEEPVVIEEAIVEDNENQAVGSTVASGTCGANLTWVLDSKGKLTISGTGEMNDYNNSSYTPWSNYRTQITEVILEKGVTSIGNNAFRREASFFGNEDNEDTIKNVTIPDTVTKIGNNAFQRCASITEIKIPDSVTKIGGCAFLYCDSLTEVTLPERLTCIEWSLFESCTRLTRVTIPASVTSIERRAFMGCSSLTDVTIPEGVTSIEDYTFWSCRSLKEVTIPNSVTSIGLAAFYRCTQLTNLIIPDSIMSIVESAFLDCSNLIVYTPGEYVISYCKSNRIKCCPYIKELSPEPGTENFDVTNKFKIEFSMNISGNDGYAHLMSGSTIIDSIRLDDEYVEGHKVSSRILILDFKNIEIGKSCYITIDEGALNLYGDSSQDTESENSVSYPGLDKNVWTFSTVNLDYASFTNPNLKTSNDEISKELFEKVFIDPTIAGKLYKKKANRLPGGICFGMSYVAAAKKKGYSVANGYGKLRSYNIGNYKEKTSGQSYSLSEYIKMAQIYQLMSSLDYEANEKTKDKYEDIIKKIKANEQVVISIWKEGFNEHRHAILPITITKETDEKIEVLVYDCNGYYIPSINAKTYLNTIVFFKTEDKIDGFEYNDSSKIKYTHMGINTVDKQFELIITGYDYAEDIKAQYKEHPLVQSRNRLDSTDLIELTYAAGDENEDEEDYLYWAESPSYEDVLETDNTISITNGPDEIEITANAGASVRLDIANNTSKIDNSNASSKDYTITHTHAEDYDNTQSVVIKGETSSTVNTEKTDDGIIVSNEDNTPVEAEITVTENGEEVASANITATTDSVNVVYDDDNGLTVLEDTDSDGTYETVINTSDEKTIENAEITGISNKQYTGSPVVQSFTVKSDGVQLNEGTDYKVEYSNNTNIGTATITITGIGDYTGTVTETFLILPGKTTRGDLFNLANNIKVTWEAVPGAKYYKVYRNGVSEPVIVTTGLVGWDTCTTPKLEPGKMYTYKIVASTTGKGDSSGDSSLSYTKSIYRLQTTAFKYIKNTAPGKVTVSYKKSDYGDSYVLLYADNEEMKNAKSKVIYGADTTSVVLGGFKKGKTYWFQIRVRKSVAGYKLPFYTTFGAKKTVTIKQ